MKLHNMTEFDEMERKRILTKIGGMIMATFCLVANGETNIQTRTDRWQIDETGVVWQIDKDSRLPHGDWLEMSGRGVSVLLAYDVAADRSLTITPTVLFPKLR